MKQNNNFVVIISTQLKNTIIQETPKNTPTPHDIYNKTQLITIVPHGA
jgi:hypothetical protein